MKYRSIFISDIHLGTHGCQADLLNRFLKEHDCEKLYLIGDIFDGWRLKQRWYLPQNQVNVVHKVLKKAKNGTDIYYVSGNHDEFLRGYVKYEISIGNIHIDNEFTHVGVDGKRYLVTHGDMFDGVTRYHKWLSMLGDHGYTFLLKLNQYFNWCRRKMGMGYWSLSKYIKHKVKTAANFIGNFEENLAGYARKRKFDGVICGHIHTAEIRMIDDIIYMNDGDWVESCTALVEHFDGRFEIIYWS